MVTNGRPSPTELELLGLTIQERSGREIAKRFKEVMGREISYGTLYTTLRRMSDAGLVRAREDHDEDGRVRYYKITAVGARAWNAARDSFQRIARIVAEERS